MYRIGARDHFFWSLLAHLRLGFGVTLLPALPALLLRFDRDRLGLMSYLLTSSLLTSSLFLFLPREKRATDSKHPIGHQQAPNRKSASTQWDIHSSIHDDRIERGQVMAPPSCCMHHSACTHGTRYTVLIEQSIPGFQPVLYLCSGSCVVGSRILLEKTFHPSIQRWLGFLPCFS